jgi:nitroreductase family protein
MFDLRANPWTVLEADFPITGTPAEQLHFLLSYAVLAPSEYNTQPWLFKVTNRTIELYTDRSRRLPRLDPDDRELTISCGAACLNLRLALRHFGYADEVNFHFQQDTPDLLARVSLGRRRRATREEHELFHAILRRRTNRQAFEDRAVPPTLLSTLKEIAGREGVWFQVVRGEEARQAVANLIATGDRVQWADKQFRQELAQWVRPRGLESHDGLPGYAHAKGTFASSVSPFVVRTFNMGDGEAARGRQLAAGSPVLAVLGTFGDSRSDWFSTGQAVEKVILGARAEGIWASFVNQPIEVPSLRTTLCEILGRPGFPQIVLRMGYGPEVAPTPRRSVSEVLL